MTASEHGWGGGCSEARRPGRCRSAYLGRLRLESTNGPQWWKRLLWAAGYGMFGLANLLTSAAGLDSMARFPGEGACGPSWSHMSEVEFGTWVYIAIGLGLSGTAVGLVVIEAIVGLGKAIGHGRDR